MRKSPPPVKRSPNPLEMAESVCERLEQVPWPLSVWLTLSKDGTDAILTHRSETPEEARYRALGEGIEVGTYRKGHPANAIRDDILAAYGEAK